MDLQQSRGYFDAQVFDTYDKNTQAWTLNAFTGQLDLANPKVSLMNKGTRRRMLYVSPGSEPVTGVIRVGPTNTIFLAGQQSKDVFRADYLRDVISLHEAVGPAIIQRRQPVGPPQNPGWAVSSLIETTFGDYEMRSGSENQETQITQWGSWEVTLPKDSAVQEHDTVTINGRTFFIFVIFNDSGMRGCHATDRGDDRVDVVYKSLTGSGYDATTLKQTKTYDNYNVTMEITPYETMQDAGSTTNKIRMRAMIKKTWLGPAPKMNDLITYLGQDYYVARLAENKLHDEWHLVVDV